MSTVKSWGTGRADYSDNVEFSTVPLIRSHQTRKHYTFIDYLYYAIDWPYAISQTINASPFDTTYAGAKAAIEYYKMYTNSLSIECDSNTLCWIGLQRYTNYAAIGGEALNEFGYAMGYGKAELYFDKAIPWDPAYGYIDIMVIGASGDNNYPSLPRGWPPDYVRMTVTVHQVEERVAGPVINE